MRAVGYVIFRHVYGLTLLVVVVVSQLFKLCVCVPLKYIDTVHVNNEQKSFLANHKQTNTHAHTHQQCRYVT